MPGKFTLIRPIGCCYVMLLFLNVGCSTALVRLLPGSNGSNQVVASDIEADSAEQAAIKAAQKYCQKSQKQAIFSDKPQTSYTGSMDPNTRRLIRQASGAAMIVGSMASVQNAPPGQFNQGGQSIEYAGVAGREMTSDRAYRTEISFTCQ